MPADMFLEIVTKKGGKVRGESLDSVYKGEIPVEKFEMGVASPADYDKSKTGRITLEHVKFDFPASIASKTLFQTLCTNDEIKTATLTVRRPGADASRIFFQWRFNDARLVSYKMTGEKEETTDSITVAYSGVEISYRQHHRDGKVDGSSPVSYDANTNTMVKPTLT